MVGVLVVGCAALVTQVLIGTRVTGGPLRELMDALAREPTRVADARLSDGLAYRPPPVQTRGAARHSIPPDVTIAAAQVEQWARERDTPRTSAALGVAYLALGDWDNAVESLSDAVRRAPNDAGFLNDLAGAYLTRAATHG
ncbi:MAG TPA: tetratricopeptide repeat protein, partial [Vicinamibacterales bacterium]|nr:tetratricopeptide repeat protein [Vicinamibacterales bacterium]